MPLELSLSRCAAALTAAVLLLQPASPTANLCSTQGLCCKHRDSGCVVQNVLKNHSVDTSALPCYCDHACLKLDDCCIDYREFCSGESDEQTPASLNSNTNVHQANRPIISFLARSAVFRTAIKKPSTRIFGDGM